MSTLTLVSKVLAYDDETSSSNPSLKAVEWCRSTPNIEVQDPQSKIHTLDPNSSTTVFDGTRATSIDGTSTFGLGLSVLDPSRYRLTYSSGTAPAFRTDRAINLSTLGVTFTVNSNLSVTVTTTGVTPFSAVQNGDVFFIPGISTGDAASPFNSLNLGYWTVLSIAGGGASITISRIPGATFEGITETVTVATAYQAQAYSTSGVQPGDFIQIVAGFSITSRRSYAIVAVNPSWVEFVSTLPIGAETGIIPGVGGLIFYTNAKRYLYVETNQECTVQINGDAGSSCTIQPWIPGDPCHVGKFEIVGSVWKTVLVNKAPVASKTLVITVE